MPINLQDNLLHPKEWHVRTELWKDKIYHIPINPYKFPKNDGSGDFMPLPRRFQEIITEFRKEIDKQKATERTKEEREEAKEIINEIYQEIKDIIQQEIENTEEEEFGKVKDWREWKNLNIFFTEELVKEWLIKGFNYNQTADWINIGLKPTESSYADWLQNEVEFNSWQYLNETSQEEVQELRKQYFEHQQNIKPEQIKERLQLRYQAWNENKQEKLKQLQLGLRKNAVNQFKRLNKEYLDSNKQVEKLLKEWEKQKKIVLDRKNVCFIENNDQEGMVFCYQPPKGDFHAIQDFLWYRNNIWYETVSWQGINHENVIVLVKRSFFIHNYLPFVLKGANGIFHNHPLTKSNNEVCQCPSFLESTDVIDFVSDWQPTYQLFKSISWFSDRPAVFELSNSKGKYPVFHTLTLEKVEASMVSKSLTDATFFLLPKDFDGSMLYRRSHNIKFFSAFSKTSLKGWLDNYQANRGQDNQHLLKKVNVNFIWNSKVIFQSVLDDFDFDSKGNPVVRVEIRANPSETMYLFTSKKILFRYSEDLEFTLQADKLASIGTSLIQKFTGININEVTRDYLHNADKEKSQKDERSWERKSKMITTSAIAQTLLGTVPSLVDASHTRNDYTLAEFALRFDSSNNFSCRLEYNRNQFNRYQMMKKLKKPCNKVFNTEKFGNYLHKGYIKAIANIFEGDRNGYFAGLLSRGIYFYKYNPNEYFLEKFTEFGFKNEIANREVSGIKTTIQENYSSAFGRDDQVHVDGLSWVWKDSFCRGEEEDLFPKLIEQGREHIKKDEGGPITYTYYKWQVTSQEGRTEVDYSTKKYFSKEEWDKIPTSESIYKSQDYDYSRLEYIQKEGRYIDKETQQPPTDADKKFYTCDRKPCQGLDSYSNMVQITEEEYNNLPKSYSNLKLGDWWGFKYQNSAGAWKFDGTAQWSGIATLKVGVQYDWWMHAFSSGQTGGKKFRGLDDGVKVIIKQNGADWELAFLGRVEITEVIGNPDAIGGGTEIEEIVENLPAMEDEKQTSNLDTMKQAMKPEKQQ